jgi:uncharacterized protein (DUF2141 family)
LRKVLALGFVIVSALLTTPVARAGELRVTITDVRSDSGELLIGLYETAEGFLAAIANAETSGIMADRNRLIGVAMRARPGPQQAVFARLPPGRYAVIVVHDENDNGRLDANVFGVPTEGYGFSNDARGFLSAPSFDAAAITIGNADASIAISLTYPPPNPPEDETDLHRQFEGSEPEK